MLQDTISTSLTDAGASDLVALCRDLGSNNLFVLTDAGVLYSIDPLTGSQVTKQESWVLNSESNNSSHGWFNVTIVNETGAIVCISHSGLLVSIKEDPVSCQWSHTVEQEGDVEGGIATAAWSPDTSRLALLTNNNTLLLMTGFWDVLAEIPLPTSRVPNSPCGISWRGDGEYLSVVTTDADDGISRARVYTKELELHATGRNIADGPGSVLKGLSTVVAYATNGSLIALTQRVKANKLQVVFIERNGLRHGEFDIRLPDAPAPPTSALPPQPQPPLLSTTPSDTSNIQTATTTAPPPITPAVGSSTGGASTGGVSNDMGGQWEVHSLYWDMPSTLLAVGLVWTSSSMTGTT